MNINSATVRDVYLTGQLGKRFGRKHRLSVGSPAEAVRALSAMVKGFQQFLMESGDRGIKYHVFIGDQGVSEEQLNFPAGKDSITFSPVYRGAKNGVIAAIAGVVLIVVGVFLMFTPFAALAPYVIGAGVGLLAIGAASMLAVSPKSTEEKERADNRPSSSFNGPVNTQAQGAPVAYFAGGPAYIGSAVISAEITTEDGVYVPSSTSAGVGGGGSVWAQLFREVIANQQNAN